MMEGWKEYRIKDLGRVVTGKTPPTKITEYFGEGYAFITPTDLVYDNYYINYTERQVTELAKSKFKNYFLPPNSISYTCIGATVGKSCLNREYVLTNQQINSIIPNEKHDAHFIYYYLNIITPSIVAIAGGAATPIINKSSFEGFKIFAPPLPIQRKIAKILSAYDDLIENNLKRIKLLEEMAQKTYEEWFVRLKFPGHETAKFDKKTGLPEGWKRGKLNDLVGFVSGYAFKSKDFQDKGISIIKIKNIGNNTVDIFNTDFVEEKIEVDSKFNLVEGDLINAMTGATIGKVGFIPANNKKIYLNQRVGKFIPKGKVDNTVFTYTLFNSEIGIQQILNFASGAAQPNISGKEILSVKTVVPDEDTLRLFSNLASPMIKTTLKLYYQNQRLKEARDILLPRLMTGMIDVDKIELEL